MYKFVMQQLQEHKGQWGTICRKTKLKYSWLSKVAVGAIPNPGIKKLQKLYDYFTK